MQKFLTDKRTNISSGGTVADQIFSDLFKAICPDYCRVELEETKYKIFHGALALSRGLPFFTGRFKANLRTKPSDIIIANGFRAGACLQNNKRKSDYIYLAHNCEHELFMCNIKNRYYNLRRLESRFYRNLESQILSSSILNIFFTESDLGNCGRTTGVKDIIMPPDFGEVKAQLGQQDFILYPTNFNHPPSKNDFFQFLECLAKSESGFRKEILVCGSGVPVVQFNSCCRGIGFLSRDEFYHAMEASLFVIAPSYTGSGFPFKIVEAVRNGKLVLTFGSRNLSSPVATLNENELFDLTRDDLNQLVLKQYQQQLDFSAQHARAVIKIKERLGI